MLIIDRRKFTFTSQNDIKTISDTLSFIDSEIEKFKTPSREASKIRMMCEESLMRLLEYSCLSAQATHTVNNVVTVEVSASNFLGNVKFVIKIPGKYFNFLDSIQTISTVDSVKNTVDSVTNNEVNKADRVEAVDTVDTDSDPYEIPPEISDAINGVLLQQFTDRISYEHRHGINYIKISALRSPYNFLFEILGAIFLAILTGIAMRISATPEACSYVQTGFLEPVSSLIMNAMKMCTIPLVFFSIMLCIASFGSLADMKRIALRCMACFFSIQTVTALICIGVFFMLKPAMASIAGVLAGMVEAGAKSDMSFFAKILTELVPPSLVEPFLDNDVPQLLILGLLFGFALRQTNTKKLRDGFEELNNLLIKALDIVLRFTPVIVFCSIFQQVLELGLDAVVNMAWLVVCIVISELAVMAVYCIAVRVTAGLNVKKFMEKAHQRC